MSIFEENPLTPILQAFGELKLDYFSDRLRLQKLGYLAQKMGVSGGFPYSWYIRGPYSRSLTSFLFMGDDMDAFSKEFPRNQEQERIVIGI